MHKLNDEEFAALAAHSEREQVPARRMLFRRGDPGRALFIIESGSVRLEFGDTVADRTVHAREYFGELALFVGQHARMASATALEDSVLLKLPLSRFEALLEEDAPLLARFMLRSFAYLVASEQQLISKLRRRNEDLQQTLDLLRRTQSELNNVERLTQTDELTGLNNRRGLYGFLSDMSNRRIPGTRLALTLVDCDRFKNINDLNGHLAGDFALRAIAQLIMEASQPCDLPVRLGGDEFGLLLQVRSNEELEERVRQLTYGVREIVLDAPNESLKLSVSVGATWCDEERHWPDWYGTADNALYKVKSDGGNGYSLDLESH